MLSAPSTRDIMGVNGGLPGVSMGPTGGFGAVPSNVPFREWDGKSAAAMAAFTRMGEPPAVNTGISFDAWITLQYTYVCPPVSFFDFKYMMPETLVFALKAREPDFELATPVVPIFALNRLLRDAARHFDDMVLKVGENQAEAQKFEGNLKKYGEAGLESYKYALDNRNTFPGHPLLSGKNAELADFYEKATTDDRFVLLTRVGILSRYEYLGSVINTNRATSLESEDVTPYEDHYAQVNVAMGKRARVANVFGHSNHVVMGTALWLVLLRYPNDCHKQRTGCYQVVPYGSITRSHPPHQYTDIGGHLVSRPHSWRVGVVLEKGEYDPQDATMQLAAGTSDYGSDRAAYEAQASLPVLVVSLAIKN